MSVSFNTQSDPLDTLPTDKTIPTHSEIQIVDTLFKENHSTIQKIFNGTKDVFIFSGLFLLLSLPQIDDIIIKFVPSASTSPYMLLFAKTVVFAILYFLVKNWYLVRK
jgi:hypothetical protein